MIYVVFIAVSQDTTNNIPQVTKDMQLLINLSSCENYLNQTSKIVIQLDCFLHYKNFEVHAYVMIKIKEVQSSNVSQFSFQFSMTPV